MSRYVYLERRRDVQKEARRPESFLVKMDVCGWEEIRRPIPESLSDADILKYVSESIIHGPIGGAVVRVEETSGDVRCYHNGEWFYRVAVTEQAQALMLKREYTIAHK